MRGWDLKGKAISVKRKWNCLKLTRKTGHTTFYIPWKLSVTASNHPPCTKNTLQQRQTLKYPVIVRCRSRSFMKCLIAKHLLRYLVHEQEAAPYNLILRTLLSFQGRCHVNKPSAHIRCSMTISVVKLAPRSDYSLLMVSGRKTGACVTV